MPPLGITCVEALYGTGPNDLYAVVSTTSATRILQWDGSQWSALITPAVDDADAGSAVPGLSALVGFRGFGAIATPPAAFQIKR